MANILVKSFLALCLSIATFGYLKTLTTNDSPKLAQPEKLTRLHFYFHDVVSGRNPTAVPVVRPAQAMPFSFGMIWVMDDLLTEGPEPNSNPVGRAQGFYSAAALNELGFLQAMNLVFVGNGPNNGSALTVLGRNVPFHDVREMPIVGGVGRFRLARGYALARTHTVNFTTGDAIVEYNVYVTHT